MSLERLWAGWRAEYLDGPATAPLDGATNLPAGSDCVFCGLGEAEDLDQAMIVAHEGPVYVVLNAYPYVSGHLLIVPRRHEGELDGLTPEESAGVLASTQRATTALKAAYRPDGINVGINLGRAAGAGLPGHLHVHVLPRWYGDTNFLTSVAEARILPESLSRTLERVKAAWPPLASDSS